MPVFRCAFQDARGTVLHVEAIECPDNSAALAEASKLMASVSGECRSVHVHDGVAVVGVRYINPSG